MINTTLEKLYNFIQTDKQIKDDFEEYVKTMGAKDTPKNMMSQIYIPYIFERHLPDIKETIPELFYNSNKNDKLAKALINAQSSIYEVKRVLKKGFELYNIINEKNYTVQATSKMTIYRGIGIGHYVVARIFEFDNNYYLIEISGVLASNKKENAMRYAVAKIIQEPHLVYTDNNDKQSQIEDNINKMYKKFIECFNTNEILTTNKYTDEIISMFNEFAENDKQVDFKDKLDEIENYKFFEVKGLQNDYNNFLEKSLDGFSAHKETYDVGIIYDKDFGLYVVPFYKTFSLGFERTIENHDKCIKYFMTTEAVSPNILKIVYEKYNNFMEVVNKALGENLTYDELLIKYKPKFMNKKFYSHTTVLYNSKVFSNTLGIIIDAEEKSSIDYSNTKRNDSCPCGSGKKFKHCCLK